jgi:undecaprenyl-diphosphatase
MTTALRCISRLGDGWLWLALAIALWLRGYSAALQAELLAVLLAVLVFIPLKDTVARTRPHGARDWSRFIASDKYSFPSGHANTAFAVATAVSFEWHRLAWLLLPVAILISITRVACGHHDWIDVFGGAALGVVCGAAATIMMRCL